MFITGSVAFMAVIWFVLLRHGAVSLYFLSGWLIVAILAISVVKGCKGC